MNPARVAQLKRELVGQIEYDMMSAQTSDGPMAEVSFKAVVLNGSKGPIKVVADRYCPYDRVYLLQLDTWSFYEIGDVGFINHEGTGNFLHIYNSDGIEGRLGYYGQLVCECPGWNGTGDLSDYTGA